MIGVEQGKLTVKSKFRKNGRNYVICNCDCGNEKTTREDYFLKSKISSCGCDLWNYHNPSLRNEYLLDLYHKKERSFSQFYGTRIHNTWRSIRFTIKGKKAGSPDKWADFFRFIDEVQDGYQPSLFMQRLNQNLPFSEDNFEWVEKSRLVSRNNRIILEYKGDCFTIKELSDRFGVGVGAIKYRLRKGLSVEDAVRIKMKKPPRPVKSHTEMSLQQKKNKASKMVSSYRHSDKCKGLKCDLDVDFMLEEIFSNPCSYCGTLEKVGCDRLDNSKGHVKSNVVPACYNCNTIRKDLFSFEEMVKIGKFLKRDIYDKR